MNGLYPFPINQVPWWFAKYSTIQKILAFFDHFYPSIRSGGPAKSSLGFAQALSEFYDVTIITSAYDYGETRPHPQVVSNEATHFSGFTVYYLDAKGNRVLKSLLSNKYDFVYLNSFFSFQFTIKPLWRLESRFPLQRFILAARGEFAKNAIAHKGAKKKIYLSAFRILLEPKDITYQATSNLEKEDIQKYLPNRHIKVAPNLRPITDLTNTTPALIEKKKGELKICLISRINKIKNIDRAISWVISMKNLAITFDIYGFIEDKKYFEYCLHLGGQLINFKGDLAAEDVIPTIQKYHIFFLPTKGENFGHVILESFISGRPVLISDKTPWRQLALDKAGIDAELTDAEISKALNFFVVMDNSEFENWCRGARNRAEVYFYDTTRIQAYMELFS